jgi:adenylate cyclase
VQGHPQAAVPEHRRVACLYADLWSQGLTTESSGETKRLLVAGQEMIAGVVGTYLGRVDDIRDDGLLATFLTVPAAVRCAVEIQHRMRLRNTGVPPGGRLEVRVGIELGHASVDDGRLDRGRLDLAARVRGIAAPGAICLSESALDRISPLLVPCRYVGERAGQDGRRAVRIYQIQAGCGQ